MTTHASSFIVLGTLFLFAIEPLLSASPVSDLASPEQAVRDRAAAELRTSFRKTPEEKWKPTVQQIKPGQTKKEVQELLRPFNVTEGCLFGNGHAQFRLDDQWSLLCTFQNADGALVDRKLVPSVRHVWTDPPKDFSGLWIVYYVNGQKSYQISYQDGAYRGEFISYYPDGSTAYVQHYTTAGADGDDTGFHPSGKVSYRAHYKYGKPVGTWTWYDEAGKVTSTLEHQAP